MKNKEINWWVLPYWIYIVVNIVFITALVYTTIILLPTQHNYESREFVSYDIAIASLFFIVFGTLWFMLVYFARIQLLRGKNNEKTLVFLAKKPALWLILLLGVVLFLAFTALFV